MTTKKTKDRKAGPNKIWLVHVRGHQYQKGNGKRSKETIIDEWRVVLSSTKKDAMNKARPLIEKVKRVSFKSRPLEVSIKPLDQNDLVVYLASNGSERTKPVKLVLSEADEALGYQIKICVRS